MIDAILTNTMLPRISREYLERLMDGKPVERVRVTATDGDFGDEFE
ncbi:MAG: hypothetical protein WBC44_09160 [Planctomycetaceae bacterium]